MAVRTITLQATFDLLAMISEFVVEGAQAAGLDEHAVWEVQLATDEAVTNVIQHSYAGAAGPLTIQTEVRNGAFVVTLIDHGRPFDPDAVPEPDLVSPLEERRTGGLGLYLMRKLMDRVEFSFEPDRNILQMSKRLRTMPYHVVTPRGRIDASTAARLSNAVREAMAAGHRRIIVDLRDVTFLSSSGLRALLLLARELRKEDGDLVLCAPQPQVAEVFHLTGFDQIFALHHTREEAASALNDRP
ncbi:anti-sigma factor antagonist [Kallotenue papyrolyticum]|uniref:anti-sigma factor antagonist n=1 Tax=Kallotenue papyrolyticum TaxID=1325125 RepID=UPI000472D3DF|nr:anti-sigma factor antagonist [Kallotenue papyrolyticum]